MALRFLGEAGCAVVMFEGEYDGASALGVIDDALRELAPASGLLLDLSDSLSFRTRSSEDLRGMASFLATKREQFGARLALVGSSDLAYGLLRMGTVFAAERGIESAAFRSREAALNWLCSAVSHHRSAAS